MQRSYSSDHEAFRQSVEAFIDRYWPGPNQEITPASLNVWRTALARQGWSVPDWPQHAGGAGWDPTQRYIWHQACASHGVTDSLGDSPGIAVIGPLLLSHGHAAAVERFIPAIRELSARWCLGVAEPEVHMNVEAMATHCERQSSGLCVTGHKILVAGASSAQWLCVLAKLAGEQNKACLIAVDLNQQGVTLTPQRTLDQATDMAQVDLQGVIVEADGLLVGPEDAGTCLDLLGLSITAGLTRSAVAEAQLAQLDVLLQDLPDEQNLHTERHQLAIELSGLQALELRYIDALQRNVEVPVPVDLLRLKSRDILLQLGALQVRCFGYYALPYPDELLLHNEGPIGPQGAVAAMRNALVQQVANLYEGSAEELKDKIARHLELPT